MNKRQVRWTPAEYKVQQYRLLADIVKDADLSPTDAQRLMEFGVSNNLVFGNLPAWLMVAVRFIAAGEGFKGSI